MDAEQRLQPTTAWAYRGDVWAKGGDCRVLAENQEASHSGVEGGHHKRKW